MDDEAEHDGRLPQADGFDAPDEQVSDRVIIGLLHTFDSSGEWFKGGLPNDPTEQPAAVSMRVILQRWKDKRVIDMRTKHPLPDLKSLNQSVPMNEWELDLNGNPRPPWQRTYILYFLDLDTAERSTFASSTVGAEIAVARLKDKISWMRRMRGANVVPQIEFSWAPMKTRFGPRKRPEFKVIKWIDLGGGDGGPCLVPPSKPKQLPPAAPKEVEEPSLKEELDDAIGF
jgi:hypothetical protein